MKIFFFGLGPKDSVSYNRKLYKNSDVVDMEDEIAQEYISLGLARQISNDDDIEQAIALEELELKNQQKRENLINKRREIYG